MCGRFTLAADINKLAAVFYLRENIFSHTPRYNIAPGQEIAVITKNPGGREISLMKWGLIPHWAKDKRTGYKMINARAETIDNKPAFKGPFLHRRCLIPADGFYDWKKLNGEKEPIYITLPGRTLFAFAGIWNCWAAPGGEAVYTCSIITTPSNEYIRAIHDRMPVILDREQEHQAWLEMDEPVSLKKMLRPYQGKMTVYPVSKLVNSPKTDSRQLIEPHFPNDQCTIEELT
ncbi:MAG: SOS response-associated peptidase [Desulfotomaculaceae bacterium]|nr:SOS response-associated peptidase [Desulfotomaculaceae bacterium]